MVIQAVLKAQQIGSITNYVLSLSMQRLLETITMHFFFGLLNQYHQWTIPRHTHTHTHTLYHEHCVQTLRRLILLYHYFQRTMTLMIENTLAIYQNR